MPDRFTYFQLVLGIVAQLFLCRMFWRSCAASHLDDFVRLINPASWFVGFYLLWFILPQVLGLFYGLHIIGLENEHVYDREYAYFLTQQYCILFLIGINLPSLVPVGRKYRNATRNRPEYLKRLSVLYRKSEILFVYEKSKLLIYLLLLVGLCGGLYVASQNLSNLEGFRSQIVKTPLGKIATSTQFFGAFAISCISVCLILRKKYLLLFVLVSVYAGFYIFTGARGRLLWPFAITGIYLVAVKGEKFKLRYLIYIVLGLGFLLSMDPIVKWVKYGEMPSNDLSTFLAPLVYKRNFDGFPNFAFVLFHDNIEPSIRYLFVGAREEFMTTYFPRIWAAGVGWGVTIPGLIYLSSKNVLLFVFISMLYGLSLRVINRILRKVRKNLWFWSYLFAMTWYCALGGNLIESLDKMVAAGAAPVFLLAYQRFQRAVAENIVPSSSSRLSS